MSSKDLKTLVEDTVLKQLKESSGDKGMARGQLMALDGQFYVVDPNVLFEELDHIATSGLGYPTLNKKAKFRIYKNYRRYLKKHEKSVWKTKADKDKFKSMARIRDIGGIIDNKGRATKPKWVYIVRKYDSMKKAKRNQLGKFIADEYEKLEQNSQRGGGSGKGNAGKSFSRNAIQDAAGGGDDEHGWQLGHGEYETLLLV